MSLTADYNLRAAKDRRPDEFPCNDAARSRQGTHMPSFGPLEPMPGAPMNLSLLLSDPFATYRDGTSTRVYDYEDDRVIVVTFCDVKAAFLEALSLVPGGIPGLPVVHRSLGDWAKDPDNIRWGDCFEVERLEHAPSADAQLKQSRLFKAAHAEMGMQYGFSARVDAITAKRLAKADIEGTGQAFEFIARFLQDNDAVLDALVPRNVMFTKVGRLCLADPVSFVPPSLPCDV